MDNRVKQTIERLRDQYIAKAEEYQEKWAYGARGSEQAYERSLAVARYLDEALTVDDVNRKYTDLRHAVMGIDMAPDTPRSKTIAELQDVINRMFDGRL